MFVCLYLLSAQCSRQLEVDASEELLKVDHVIDYEVENSNSHMFAGLLLRFVLFLTPDI